MASIVKEEKKVKHNVQMEVDEPEDNMKEEVFGYIPPCTAMENDTKKIKTEHVDISNASSIETLNHTNDNDDAEDKWIK